MTSNPGSYAASDPFMSFWTDFMGRLAAQGATLPNPSQELLNQLRKNFFQALAENMDQYMRSDQFMAQIKQSMDQAVVWQQMLNQYMQKGLEATPLPTRVDLDQVVQLARGMEHRVLEKLAELTQRVDRLEAALVGKPRKERAGGPPSPAAE